MEIVILTPPGVAFSVGEIVSLRRIDRTFFYSHQPKGSKTKDYMITSIELVVSGWDDIKGQEWLEHGVDVQPASMAC